MWMSLHLLYLKLQRKMQCQQMVKLLLKLDQIPKPDDAADAIACAITHCQAGRMKSQFLMK